MARLLDSVNDPADLRRLSLPALDIVAGELRREIIQGVSEVGGHLASTLGAIELTVALHYAFDTPEDRLVWDTGHQCYAHKVLCGRRDRLCTIRQLGGISGFLTREESPHDVFGAGHAGTAVSAALGIAEANALKGNQRKVVAVISDGGLTTGLMFEGLNQAGHLERDLIVVLNDNAIFIDPRVGAFSSFLSRQLTTDFAVRLQKQVAKALQTLPKGDSLYHLARRIKDSLLGFVTPGLIFEALGFQYVGPIDGHDIASLVRTFENVKRLGRPVLVHALTQKGKGYLYSEKEPVRYHSVTPFHVKTGQPKKPKAPFPAYTEVFSRTLVSLAKQDPRIVAITAAMGSGTGIDRFAREFPERAYDVGIAEQHAVTFAAGLAIEGLVPVVAIYSTFLQRAYDQILHDICLQNLHVIFALDRAGLVGADGPTHHGVFDFTYLRSIPNMVVMAPKDDAELEAMLRAALDHEGPVALRYPRGEASRRPGPSETHPLPIGKAEVLRSGNDIVLAAIGATVGPAVEAAQTLAGYGIEAAVLNARFVKPIDGERLRALVQEVPRLITVEDHAVQGGFGSAVLEHLAQAGMTNVRVRCLGIPDRFVGHGTQQELRKICGIDRDAIVQAALGTLDKANRTLMAGPGGPFVAESMMVNTAEAGSQSKGVQ